MSVAIRCDRCGKIFDAPKYRLEKRIRLIHEDINDVEDTVSYDLCPECDKEFRKWFKNKEE